VNKHRERRARPAHEAPFRTVDSAREQLGQVARQLRDALDLLDVLPGLQQSGQYLPDARARLSDIERRSFAAADKVLTAVEQAKQERARIAAAAQRMALALGAGPLADADQAALSAQVAEVNAAAARTDALLTDIMVAQDFHDLTGQMLQRIAALAVELESSLQRLPAASEAAPQRDDSAKNQREVDELLAGYGF
jgi:chemotaxis protein CheZ